MYPSGNYIDIMGLLSHWLSVHTYDIIIGAVTLLQNLKGNKSQKLKESTDMDKTAVRVAKSGKWPNKKKRKRK